MLEKEQYCGRLPFTFEQFLSEGIAQCEAQGLDIIAGNPSVIVINGHRCELLGADNQNGPKYSYTAPNNETGVEIDNNCELLICPDKGTLVIHHFARGYYPKGQWEDKFNNQPSENTGFIPSVPSEE